MKPSIPKGTRDFSSEVLSKRNYIIGKIKEKFELFGFAPLETPSFENLDTLMGKYGDEGNRLIYRVMNSANAKTQEVEKSDKALRYDLTVPFARYVVMNQNNIVFPFKRYQIQPVWRADRPQKGRFREFYQCDADVVGSKSLWQEVELVRLYDQIFTELGLNGVRIKINNRKILSGFAQVMGQRDKIVDFTVALDKIDKIGKDSVVKEMMEKGIEKSSIDKIEKIFYIQGDFEQKLQELKGILKESEEGLKGIEEVEYVVEMVRKLGLRGSKMELDITLARGLDYYTGIIFEVAPPKEIEMGSIGGGGRYDNLTDIFDLKDMSGVGISFGLERIYLVMEEMGLFPKDIEGRLDVLFLNMGETEAVQSQKIMEKMREKGIKAEMYPEEVKMKKQMSYADKKGVRYVAIVGEKEMEEQVVNIKNMDKSESKIVKLDKLDEEIEKMMKNN